MTEYLVLERVLDERGDSGEGELDERELWTPVGVVQAVTGDLACRAAARGDGTGTRPGVYWAVPARSVENNRTTVEVEQREVVSFRTPRTSRRRVPQA